MGHQHQLPSIATEAGITGIIRERKSIYPDEFVKKDVPQSIIEEILVNATWAPTHKMTEPWRFIVFQGTHQKKFGDYLAEYYKNYYLEKLSAEEFVKKHKYLQEYPLKSACMIAIILVRHTKIALPEWEEIAAVSCAVQNIALTCTAYGLGGYWSSTDAAIDYVKTIGLAENERSLGLFFMGHYDPDDTAPRKKRSPLSKKVTWLK